MKGFAAPLVATLFDVGIWAYILRRMRRAMATDLFRTALVIEVPTVTIGIAAMAMRGLGLTLILVLLGLAALAITLSTWGRVEVFFTVIADPATWRSRHATVVSLRFCAVAIVLCAVAMPLLLALA